MAENEFEQPQELTNVTFDEIQVGTTRESSVTLTQQQIDVAAIVSGDVDALYLKGADAGDTRQEPKPFFPFSWGADSLRTRIASVAVMTKVAHARRSGKYETR
ncbi:MAG TPA: hypothetical protein VMB77_13740 [Syntrophales bacterium]|nr:hypothetical protein [Syntrophales bacterium]